MLEPAKNPDIMNSVIQEQLKGGNGFIQLGNWRVGNVDKTHFSFSHKSTYTSVIYRKDGTVHQGPREDFNLWNDQELQKISNVKFGNNFIEFCEVWRLGQTDDSHFSLSHLSGNTCMIWRKDGTKHLGPRKDFTTFYNNMDFSGIQVGNNVIKIGNWHIGQFDFQHLSICSCCETAEILRSDGTVHNGPRKDFNVSKMKTTKPS